MKRTIETNRAEAWLERGLRLTIALGLALGVVAHATDTQAQEKLLNLYSARHYQTDEALYSNFTKQTGIRINRIEMGDEALLERLRNEGANSPADVVLLVDAARLWRAQTEGLFQPVQSKILTERIPAHLRSDDNTWFGFSTRARTIFYDPTKVKAEDVDTYAKLADPRNKGKVCTRSGSHPYMLSLIGSMVERLGEAKTEEWARGVVANMARAPKGGDTDQIRAVAAGECAIAVSNTYYMVRLMRSADPKDKDVVSRVRMVWPDQKGVGTHMNISGAAVARHAPNRANAIAFLEYLASPEAQNYFANGNNEWPTVTGTKLANPELASLGSFRQDTLPVSAIGKGQIAAQRILDRAGYR
jgi:iron(III) transport system substrate-binding protein